MTGVSIPEIRDTRSGDLGALEALYPAAFPDEDLLPVVRALLAEDDGVVSLGAVSGGAITGHVIFTRCTVADGPVALLGPLGVHPDRQHRGIGSALVREGFARLQSLDIGQVCVLGDPGYYGRFGFVAESAILPPYPLPPEWDGAWQSIVLAGRPAAGKLVVPEPWSDPALWLP